MAYWVFGGGKAGERGRVTSNSGSWENIAVIAAQHHWQGLVPLSELQPWHGAGVFPVDPFIMRICMVSILQGLPGHLTCMFKNSILYMSKNLDH